jgi:hypothetical protein
VTREPELISVLPALVVPDVQATAGRDPDGHVLCFIVLRDDLTRGEA